MQNFAEIGEKQTLYDNVQKSDLGLTDFSTWS